MTVPVADRVRRASAETYALGEGPLWNSDSRRLHWVDIAEKKLMSASLTEQGSVTSVRSRRFALSLGAVLRRRSGGLVVAQGLDLVAVNDSGEQEKTVVSLSNLGGDTSRRRINDAQVGPDGAIVTGTLSEGGASGHEALVRIASDMRVTVLDDDLGLSNGIAWSVSGDRMFSVDSLAGTVYVRAYGDRIGSRSVFARFERGVPDGICVDAEDHLWVAVWGLGEVHRLDLRGRTTEVIRVPAPHTSSVAFVGDDLSRLMITTARVDLDAAALVRSPASGALFSCVPGVQGRAPGMWDG